MKKLEGKSARSQPKRDKALAPAPEVPSASELQSGCGRCRPGQSDDRIFRPECSGHEAFAISELLPWSAVLPQGRLSMKGCIADQVAGRNRSEHRFCLSQNVRFSRGYPHRSPSHNFYEVVRRLPETAGEPYCRIKTSRVVKENEIQKTQGLSVKGQQFTVRSPISSDSQASPEWLCVFVWLTRRSASPRCRGVAERYQAVLPLIPQGEPHAP